MRKIILLLTIAALSNVLFAQKLDLSAVPQNINSSFSAKYPGVQVTQWKSGQGGYTAKFVLDGEKSLAYYSAAGDWIKTEKKIKWTWNLPGAVKRGWEKSKYVSWYVEDMKEVDAPGEQIYVMHVDNGTTLDSDHQTLKDEYNLYFSGNGDLVKKEKCEDN